MSEPKTTQEILLDSATLEVVRDLKPTDFLVIKSPKERISEFEIANLRKMLDKSNIFNPFLIINANSGIQFSIEDKKSIVKMLGITKEDLDK